MDNGWIKLHRQLQDNEFYFAEKFTKIQAWVDILLLINHKPNTFFVRGNEVKVDTGQTARSILSLSKRWKWNQRTVIKYLRLLENRQMIHIKSNHITTIITVINWQQYQNNAEQNTEQSALQSMNRVHTNNNDKKEKNDKKFIPPLLQDVRDYFKLKGYSPETASKAFEYYSANDWRDKDNKPVKNWKQKMVGVWFKPENKSVEENPNWK